MGRRAMVHAEKSGETLSLSIGAKVASFFEEWKIYRVRDIKGGIVVFEKVE